jgi:hypothetical protein
MKNMILYTYIHTHTHTQRERERKHDCNSLRGLGGVRKGKENDSK